MPEAELHLKPFKEVLEGLYFHLKDSICHYWRKVRSIIEQSDGEQITTCPRSDTVLIALMLLTIFLISAVFALRDPTLKVKRIVVAVDTVIAACLGLIFVSDLIKGSQRRRKQNLANTVLTIILTIVVFTAMYSQIWYHGLKDVILRLETDRVPVPRFPAIAFFQRQDASQAFVQIGELKCSSGPRDDHAAQCSSLSIPEALRTESCDCGDSWPTLENIERGENQINWLNQNTTYYPMIPSESTVSKGAGHFLEMQVFFIYNTSEAYLNVSLTPAPGIWMAIWDPTYHLAEAIEDGQLYTAQVDANSRTVVNIGLVYNEYLDKPPIYKYDVSVSTRQNLDLVCDVKGEGWHLCHLGLEMQIPSFIRTRIREETRLNWAKVIAEAGAYFALVQFLSWIISGAAWA